MVTRIGNVGLHLRDLDRSMAFYLEVRDALAWRGDPSEDPSAVIDRVRGAADGVEGG